MPQVQAERKPMPGKAKLVILVGALVCIVLGVLGAVWYMDYLKKQEQKQYDETMLVATQLQEKGRGLEAVARLEEYLKKDRPPVHDYQASVVLGYNLLQHSRVDEAFTRFKHAESLGVEKDDVMFAATLGGLSAQKGDKAAAIRYYEEAIARANRSQTVADRTYIPDFETRLKQLKEQP